MTTYRFLGDFGGPVGSVGYDNEDYGIEGLLSNPQYVQYWYIYLDHGDRLDFDLSIRIHQPTTDFNNNTEAIWMVTLFGINLDGTPTGDHSDFRSDHHATYFNSGVNDPSFELYRPGRWMLFEEWNTFGSMEFHASWVRTPLDDGPDHPGFTPSVSRGGGGGWHVGHA